MLSLIFRSLIVAILLPTFAWAAHNPAGGGDGGGGGGGGDDDDPPSDHEDLRPENGLLVDGQILIYTGGGGGISLQYPLNESSGNKHRKIALNGAPLSDGKPQAEEETDGAREETVIDALTLGLRHDTTDVFSSVPSADLRLEVRRSSASEVWSLFSGLWPDERPDLPFGFGWRSNMTATLTFSSSSGGLDSVTVVDDNGQQYTFHVNYGPGGNFDINTGTYTGLHGFVPIPSSRSDQNVLLTSLQAIGEGRFRFSRKYGSTIIYEMALIRVTPATRLDGGTVQRYARAIEVKDRFGNFLDYTYPTTNTLTPSEIRVRRADGLGARILISQNSKGRITQVTAPNGEITTYGYTPFSATPYSMGIYDNLTSVTAPDGGVTSYSYHSSIEYEPLEPFNLERSKIHQELAGITDPLGRAYEFEYVIDNTRRTFSLEFGYQRMTGQPMALSHVYLPDGSSASFSAERDGGLRLAEVASDIGRYTVVAPGHKLTRVIDAEGNERSYLFDKSYVEVMTDFYHSYQSRGSISPPASVFYRRMTISYHEGSGETKALLGQEVVNFDVKAGMAVSTTVDFSGNTTFFGYGDAFSHAVAVPFPALAPMVSGFYGDPTSQKNALGGTRLFTYGPHRIMTSVTDENGARTDYEVDAMGRRLSETITSANGTILSRTRFDYPDTYQHPGVSHAGASANFMTRKRVEKITGHPGDPAWVVDLVTDYLPDAAGRIWRQITDPAGIALTTEFTYDANGNRLTSTDPRGNVTTFAYDARNRLSTVTYPDTTQKTFFYDLRGNKIKEVDENDVATLWEYDALNRVVRQAVDMNSNAVIDVGVDLITSFTYNALNAKVAATDPKGTVTKFDYDALQRLIKTTKDYGPGRFNHETTYDYDVAKNTGSSVFDTSGFKPTRVTDPRGFRTEVTYDSLYRSVEEKAEYLPGVFATTAKTYDNVGNLLTVTDPLGTVTRSAYDALGRPVSVTHAHGTPLAATTSTSYTSTGFSWRIIDPISRESITEYDAAGRPVKTFAPAVDDALTLATTLVSPVTETIYDAAGNVSAVINPLGRRIDYTYDARNRRIVEEQPSVTDATTGLASRPTITTTYDPVGNVVAIEDARGNITTTLHDPARRPLTVTAPEVAKPDTTTAHPVTTMTYDPAGNVLTLTDPNGNVTVNSYDALGRLLTTTQSPTAISDDDITVTNEYDPAGNRTAVIDGKSQRTEFTYDGLNRNTSIKDPANRSVTFEFNSLNKTARVDSLSQRTEYTYDVRHRLTDVAYIGRPADNRTYAYDLVGQLLYVSEPGKGGATDVAYTYDALGRQLTETSHGRTHAYAYDLANNRITVTYGGTGTVLTSTYDELNRLATLTENSRLTTYGYDLAGNRVFQEQPNGETIETTYDALNRRTAIHTLKSGGGILQSLAHAYDLAGNLVTLIESYPGAAISGRTVTNTYDGVNRLVLEANEEGSAKTIETAYVFDKANNRTAKIVETTVSGTVTTETTDYVYNNLNQLVTYTTAPPAGAPLVVTLGYDHNGNRVERVDPNALSDTYAYDYENRLVSLTKASPGGTGTYSYVYDYRTRRVQRTEAGTTTHLVFSGGVSVSEYDGATPSVASAEYIRGSDWGGGVGGLLYSIRSGTPSFKHYNSRGDVISETDTTGATTWQATYEAFGTRTQEVGTTQDRQKANTKEEDPTGLLNEGFRYRCLETGVFITRDPLGFVDGPNMYAYVVQNPWSKFDPKGLTWESASKLFGRRLVVAGIASQLDSPVPGPMDVVATGIVIVSIFQAAYEVFQPEESAVVGGGFSAPQEQAAAPVATPGHINESPGILKEGVPDQSGEAIITTGTPAPPSPVQTARDINQDATGVIYRAPGSGTPSGKPYIGRTTHPDGPAGRGSADGRDRTNAEVVGEYDGTAQGRVEEQKAIDSEGGLDNLDNKRNEIADDKREKHGLDPK